MAQKNHLPLHGRRKTRRRWHGRRIQSVDMKNNYKNIFRSAILACLLPLALSAQKPDIRFEQLPRLERFSQSNFYCLYQDHKGFIWIGTQDGLNRYDGYEIKIYRHDPKDPGSLGVSGVSNIYEDRSGNFWVGGCLLYTSPSPRDQRGSRMPSSA